MTTSPPPNLISVKSMISIFENQSYVVNNEPTRLKQRTKSVENVSVNINSPPVKHHVNTNSYSVKKHQERNSAPETNLELAHIEQQIQHLQRSLDNYKVYSRDSHIYYQNQIFFLLTDLVNIETKNKPHVVNQKSELIELLKRLNKGLITRLPSGTKKQKTEFPLQKITKPVEEKPRAKPPKIEKQETVEQDSVEEEIEAPALSVQTLKKLFEKANDLPKESPKVTVSRAYKSFSGTSDIKYVPFSERFKSKEAESAEVTFTSTATKTFATNNAEIFENSVTFNASIEQTDENLTNGFANGKSEDTSSDSSPAEDSDESSNGDSEYEVNEESDKEP